MHTAISHVPFARLLRAGFHFDKDAPAAAEPPAKPAEPFGAMREEFTRLHTEATGVIEAAAKDNRELTDDEKKANEKRFNRMNAIKTTLDEKAKFAKLALQDDPEARGTVQKPADAPGRDAFQRSENRQTIDANGKIDRQEFNKALCGWALSGTMDRKFATITTATSSNALLPRQIAEPIVPTHANVFREAHALWGVLPISTGTTADMKIPVLDASAGGTVAEDASSETENAPSLAQTITLTPSTYQSGTAWFSNMVLAANDFDLVTYAQADLTYAKEQGLENAIAAAIIGDGGISQNASTATTSGFTYGDLVDLNRKLPRKYDRQKVIILSAEAYAAAEKLVGDTDGHPILNKDPQNQELLRFNGTPVLRCDAFEDFGAGKVIGCIFSMIGFRLRDAGQPSLARYTQNAAKPDQTGFNLFAYHAHGYAASAIAKLVCPAS